MNDGWAAEVAAWFADGGPLFRALPGFNPRAVQQQMAAAVASTIEQRGRLIIEAGTGTGKTLAYLIPALLSGRKIIVSTASRTLQTQLDEQVIPFLRGVTGLPVRSAVLKGRNNYLCRYRLHSALARETDGRSRQAQRLLRLNQWAEQSRVCDLSEVGDPGDGDIFWSRVSSTVENCLGSDCPEYAECHVVRARRAAQEAELAIVNHHLLLADFALREKGFGELLPGADVLIVDEAHHLPDIAGQFFGSRLSHRQLAELNTEIREELLRSCADVPDLIQRCATAGTALAQALAQLAGQAGRLDRFALLEMESAASALAKLDGAWSTLAAGLELVADRSSDLDSLNLRAQTALTQLREWQREDEDHIAWFDRSPQGFALCRTPHDISGKLRSLWGNPEAAWVLTSATLAVADSFDHFSARLGLEPTATELLDSPYDYASHSMLYLPPELPDPNGPGYTGAWLKAALPLLEAAGGGAFVLCTSQRAVREVAAWLRDRLPFTLLAQGEAARAELLKQFRDDGHAVLVGTHTFWEGVDVRGPALRLVVIDRLPFASPDDPVLRARDAHVRQQGGNPFTDLHLPRAVLMLKQGAGRLIRDEQDQGVLMIADPRLQNRPYGRLFLRSLPPMRRSRDEQAVCAFLKMMPKDAVGV